MPGTSLRRFVVSVAVLTGAFGLLLWAALALPPFFGCLAYSDRPGSGCPGFASAFPLGQLLAHAAAMVGWAAFGLLYYWFPALLAVTLSASTQRLERSWLRRGIVGVVTLLSLTYVTLAVGWYYSLASWAPIAIGLAGAIVASSWPLRRYPSVLPVVDPVEG